MSGGKLGFSWLNLSTGGGNIDDDAVLFKIKLSSLSDTAALSKLVFTHDPILIESIRMLVPIPSDLKFDSIQLLDPFVSNLSTSPANGSAANGSIMIEVAGGQAPYSFNWSNQAMTQNLMDVVSGSYFCTITDDLACDHIAGPFVVDQQTSFSDLDLLQNLTIQPNLVENWTKIEASFQETQVGTIAIVNLEGETIYQESFIDSKIDQVIDFRSKPSGLYFVVLNIGPHQMVRKIFKN